MSPDAQPLMAWQTKPSDRFVLRWIKTRLAARLTPRLLTFRWLRPWMITLCAAGLGVLAGLVYALGAPWLAGCLAAAAQVLDGVDGQYARLTRRQSRGGAFWDSVLDRYADGALVIGMIVYLGRSPAAISPAALFILGALALIGSNLISYSTARGATLGLDLGAPTLAGKGTRTSVMILCAWGSLAWRELPLFALWYLALHTNLIILSRLLRTRSAGGDPEDEA